MKAMVRGLVILCACLAGCGYGDPSPNPYNIDWDLTREALLNEQEVIRGNEVLHYNEDILIVGGDTPFFGENVPTMVTFEGDKIISVTFFPSESDFEESAAQVYDRVVSELTKEFGTPVSLEELNEALRFFGPEDQSEEFMADWNPSYFWSFNKVFIWVDETLDENGQPTTGYPNVYFARTDSDGRLFFFLSQVVKKWRAGDPPAE
jgi:hypothetical protein